MERHRAPDGAVKLSWNRFTRARTRSPGERGPPARRAERASARANKQIRARPGVQSFAEPSADSALDPGSRRALAHAALAPSPGLTRGPARRRAARPGERPDPRVRAHRRAQSVTLVERDRVGSMVDSIVGTAALRESVASAASCAGFGHKTGARNAPLRVPRHPWRGYRAAPWRRGHASAESTGERACRGLQASENSVQAG